MSEQRLIELSGLTTLVEQLKAGDNRAREALIEHAADRLRRLVRRQLKAFPAVMRWEESGDVLQGVLVRLYRALETCRPANTREFFALSGTLIRRELIDLKRHHYGPEGLGANHATRLQARDDATNAPPGAEPAPRLQDDPAAIVQWLELHEQVNRLPSDLLEVFNLVWYQGLSQEQAAEMLDTSAKTIQRRWPHKFAPCSAANPPVGCVEQVFVMGYALAQVLSGDTVGPGTFFVDRTAGRLYIRSVDNADPNKVPIEVSTRQSIFECKADHVRVRGIRFRYCANPAQRGAAAFQGKHNTIESCIFESASGPGAGFIAPDITVKDCVFQNNGQLGFTANGAHNMLMNGCVVRNNNTKNFPREWEAGGNKICLSRNVVIENSQFIENRGSGIWFDIGDENCTVRNCLIADNEDAGIFFEISYGLHAHDNVITGNGFAGTPGSWGAAAGICLSSSPNCLIERNIIAGNSEGFNFREQPRKTPRIGGALAEEVPVWNHDSVIRNNIFSGNRVQVWGWFDAGDERHWPKRLQEKKPSSGPSLEELNLGFRDNSYDVSAGETLFRWGPAWARHQTYQTPEAVQSELNIEQGSRSGNAGFADPSNRDYRVPADSPTIKLECYPKGTVPGVRLGIIPGR